MDDLLPSWFWLGLWLSMGFGAVYSTVGILFDEWRKRGQKRGQSPNSQLTD